MIDGLLIQLPQLHVAFLLQRGDILAAVNFSRIYHLRVRKRWVTSR